MSRSVSESLGYAAMLSVVRRALMVILLLGLSGTGAELLLLNHTEQLIQWVPLALIALSLALIGWHSVQPGRASLRVLQGAMIVFIGAGVVGCYFHYQGSMEFKLESNPSLSGWPLFWAAMRSKAPPVLAPGAMIQLGLIGLAYTYRHPALMSSKTKGSKGE